MMTGGVWVGRWADADGMWFGGGVQMRRKWANGIAKKSKFKDIRVRIRTRREHDREATAEEIAAAVADKDDKCEVSEEDVLQAYQSGQEVRPEPRLE